MPLNVFSRFGSLFCVRLLTSFNAEIKCQSKSKFEFLTELAFFVPGYCLKILAKHSNIDETVFNILFQQLPSIFLAQWLLWYGPHDYFAKHLRFIFSLQKYVCVRSEKTRKLNFQLSLHQSFSKQFFCLQLWAKYPRNYSNWLKNYFLHVFFKKKPISLRIQVLNSQINVIFMFSTEAVSKLEKSRLFSFKRHWKALCIENRTIVYF